MTYEENIKRDLIKVLEKYGITDALAVTHYEDSTQWSGGCETCGWDQAVVEIYYTKNNKTNTSGYYTYQGGFADLIRTLDNI